MQTPNTPAGMLTEKFMMNNFWENSPHKICDLNTQQYNKLYEEIHNLIRYRNLIEFLNEKEESVPAENLVIASEQPKGDLANGAVVDIGKTFIINTDEGKLALSQVDILNTIDADLDMMDDGDLMSWEVMRKDMTEKEINELPEI